MKNFHIARANKYIRDILSGKIPACIYVKQACQRQVDNLKESKKKSYPYEFNGEAAEKICKFAEMMPHVKGKWSGTLMTLEPWECFLFTTLFGWLRKKDKFRRFRELYAEYPRKNGKSVIGAIIGNYMFAIDGEPGSEVYSGATTLAQALEVFRPAWLMTQKTDGYRRKFDIELGGTEKNPGNIYSMATGSRFEAVIGKPGDGASVHCGLVDEYHEHSDDSLYDCFITGMGARTQPLLSVLTTAGTNTSYPCYAKRKQVISILSGQQENEDLFGIIYTVDSVAYTIPYPSFEKLIEGLEGECGCKCVKTIRIEKLVQEICANLVMIKNGENFVLFGKKYDLKKMQDVVAQIILTESDIQDIKGCVNHAMSKQGSIATQKQKNVQSQKGQNGKETTKINAKQTIRDGETMVAEKRRPLLEDLKNTELQTKNITKCYQNKKANVLSAEEKIKDFVLTTVMKQDDLEESCAYNVIAQLVYSEIVKQVCKKHSNTCKIHELKINTENLSIEFPPDDWTDFSVWKKANPNYGVSVFKDFLKRQYKTALQETRKQNILKCKHLNMWSNAGTAWLNMVEWEKAGEDLDKNKFWGDPVYAGLDLASKIDIAALMLLFNKEGHYYLFSNYYIPETRTQGEDRAHYAGWVQDGYMTATPGSRIDFEYIKDDIKKFAKDFDLSGQKNGGGEICNDPWNAQQLVTELVNDGIDVVEISQTVNMLSEPMKEIEAVLKDGKFHHDNNPVTTWMFGNVMCRIDKKDNVFPFKEGEDNKIDGAVATITAMARAMRKAGPSIYETRGVIAF